jgi:hypothetical protein
MPAKTARSDPLPLFGASTITAVVRAASLSCQNQEKAQKRTRDRESSGESRLIWKSDRLGLRQRWGNWRNGAWI